MLRELEEEYVFWYASDQSHGRQEHRADPVLRRPRDDEHCDSRIAKASGAALLPYYCRRIDGDDYVMSICPGRPAFRAATT